jgi:hypothetical protein
VRLVKEHQPDSQSIDSSIYNEDANEIICNIKLENHSVLIFAIADTPQQQVSMTKAGVKLIVSIYEIKIQVKELLNQLRELYQNAIECNEKSLDANI